MADFSDFQLSEYANISQAHFKTNEMITAFFRYYLLVMAIPITATVGALGSSLGESGNVDFRPAIGWSLSVLFGMFSGVGFFISRYLSGLRCEAILYAQTVNSVRDYFYQLNPDTAPQVSSVLPRDPTKPKLAESRDHSNIIYSAALLNSLYLFAGLLGAYPGALSNLLDRSFGIPILVCLALALAFFYWHVQYHKRFFANRAKAPIS